MEAEKLKNSVKDDILIQNSQKGRTDYPIQREPLNLLKHYQEQWLTHVFYDTTEIKKPNSSQSDKLSEEERNCQTLHRVMINFQNYNMNAS